MKKTIFRIENLLLLVPVFLALYEAIFMADSTLDLHLQDTYFVIAHFNIWILFFSLNLIPFCCHLLLRIKSKANRPINFTHVIVTCGLMTGYLLSSVDSISKLGEQPRRYYDFSNCTSAWQVVGHANYMTIIFFAFTLIHLLFIIYAIIKLLSNKVISKKVQ